MILKVKQYENEINNMKNEKIDYLDKNNENIIKVE